MPQKMNKTHVVNKVKKHKPNSVVWVPDPTTSVSQCMCGNQLGGKQQSVIKHNLSCGHPQSLLEEPVANKHLLTSPKLCTLIVMRGYTRQLHPLAASKERLLTAGTYFWRGEVQVNPPNYSKN